MIRRYFFYFLFFLYKPYKTLRHLTKPFYLTNVLHVNTNMSTRSDTKFLYWRKCFTNCDDIDWSMIGLFLKRRTGPEPPWVAMGTIVLRVRWIGRNPMWVGETARGWGRGWRDIWNHRWRGRLGTSDLWQIYGFMLVTQCQNISRAAFQYASITNSCICAYFCFFFQLRTTRKFPNLHW